MEQLLSASPYPILRVGENGAVVYANEASFPLLAIWEINERRETSIKYHGFR